MYDLGRLEALLHSKWLQKLMEFRTIVDKKWKAEKTADEVLINSIPL